jgi:GDPmannose 4,6-dehydratase
MYAVNGILFNHESPIRGETFVTRKITRAATRIALGLQDCLYLGNLDARRDWGHAKDFVRMQWMMLQQEQPDDYIIATGEQHAVREFVERAFAVLGMELHWQGSGIDEQGIIARLHPIDAPWHGLRPAAGTCVVAVDPRYFRPTEVDTLLGDPSKAKEQLGWTPQISFEELVAEMVQADLELALKDKLCMDSGFQVFCRHE